MRLDEIHIRDPFILLDNGVYYMYGTSGRRPRGPSEGFDVYTSDDLCDWNGPNTVFRKPDDFWADCDFWAPEVHKYNGRYYMFASFKSEKRCRATQILVADSPMGMFSPLTDEPVTPPQWECLDGTLYVDKQGTPYIVFCHEWKQIVDGSICAMKLTDDLKKTAGEPFVLFHASDPWWSENQDVYVTDGPFMYRTEEGELLLLWSSGPDGNYVQAIAYSDNGEIDGVWKHKEKLLFSGDGGHGMLFKDKSGRLLFVMHAPNRKPDERPVIRQVFEADGTLVLEDAENSDR